jgi:hypothetical protein
MRSLFLAKTLIDNANTVIYQYLGQTLDVLATSGFFVQKI